MKFTLVKVFNPSALGLNGDHYAVVADLPADLGGARRVADVLPAAEVERKQDVIEKFERAVSFLPYRRHQGGWEFDFLTEDRPGVVRHQGTMYVPERPVAGGDIVDTYFHWMCWRARVYLWAGSRERVALPLVDEARLLRSMSPVSLTPAQAVYAQAPLTRPAATL